MKNSTKIHGRNINPESCPVIETSKYVGDFWNLWILRVLSTGPQRFSDLTTHIPSINKMTLCAKLRLLLKANIIQKTVTEDETTYYALSAKGEKLKPILSAIHSVAPDFVF